MSDLETGGVAEQQLGPGEQIGGEGEGEPVTFETYLRDLTEDDVYSRLQQAGDFPTRLSAAESRMMGKLGPLTERLQGVESSLGSRQEIDVSGLKALDDYDPKLREILFEHSGFQHHAFNGTDSGCISCKLMARHS